MTNGGGGHTWVCCRCTTNLLTYKLAVTQGAAGLLHQRSLHGALLACGAVLQNQRNQCNWVTLQVKAANGVTPAHLARVHTGA